MLAALMRRKRFQKYNKIFLKVDRSLNIFALLHCWQVSNTNVQWMEFLNHWPLWSIYIAHFSMNWSNYIIMQWLPTYMTRNLGAKDKDIMYTAVPYIMNSLVGMGKSMYKYITAISPKYSWKPRIFLHKCL